MKLPVRALRVNRYWGYALAAVVFVVLFYELRRPRPASVKDTSFPATSPTVESSYTVALQLPKQGGPPGYCSSSACKECHPKQFDSWWKSHHRQMTQEMTTNTVQASFNGVTREFGGERFTLHQEGSRYWVDIEAVDSTPNARDGNRSQRPPLHIPMGMVTGSHYLQVFWLPGGLGNEQIGFPFTWLVSEKRWVQRHDAFIRDPSVEQAPEQWNQICIRCHATGARPMPENSNQEFNTHVTELGIACEACHGPGEQHVAMQRKNKSSIKKTESDPTIIQPAELDHVRSSQVCGFCHSMKWFTESEGWRQNGFRYRPGDDLELTTPIIRANRLDEQPWLKNVLSKHPEILDDFYWPDGMIRVAGREFNGLMESACYQKGKLACVTCHSMHKSDPDKQVKEGMEGNAACLQCHQEYSAKLVEHTHHAPDSAGSLCYNCHMPYTSYGLLRGIRSHQIERPSVQASLKGRRPNACNQCHLNRTLEWSARQLASWYGQAVPELTDDDRKISAIVKDLLSGDAGLRALAAFSMAWPPALVASGEDWQAPLLAHLLEDPYAAVRFIAYRSLGRLPGFETFPFDFEAQSSKWIEAREQALALWRSQTRALPQCEETLVGPGSLLNSTKISQLQAERDNRPLHLRE